MWFTKLHGEEKREEGVRSDQNEMRWNQKRTEQAMQTVSRLHSLDHSETFTELYRSSALGQA